MSDFIIDGDVGTELWSVASCLNLVVNTTGTLGGESEGTIELLIEGGIPPYEITWSNGDTLSELIDLAEGGYTATVRDSSGCIATIVATIESFSAIISENSSDFELTPNPASNSIILITDSSTPIYLYNSTGNLIKVYNQIDSHKIELAISSLSPGLYIIKQGNRSKWWTKF